MPGIANKEKLSKEIIEVVDVCKNKPKYKALLEKVTMIKNQYHQTNDNRTQFISRAN